MGDGVFFLKMHAESGNRLEEDFDVGKRSTDAGAAELHGNVDAMRPKASGHVVGFHFFGAASENARGFVRTGYVGKDAAQGSRIGELRAYDGVDGANGCPEAGAALHAFILIDGRTSAVGGGDNGSDGTVGAALPAADAVRGNEHFGVSAKESEGRNDGALEFVKNELLHFRTLESGLKCSRPRQTAVTTNPWSVS